jgi:hypothetical protein
MAWVAALVVAGAATLWRVQRRMARASPTRAQ